MSESIYGEYLSLTKKYKELYGQTTIVLLQVGAFFEVYGFKVGGDVQDSEIEGFSKVCNLNISEKKYEYQGRQVMMAGFRDYTLDKYLEKLTENGYTAVVYVQRKCDNKIIRELDSVHSAGTYMSYDTTETVRNTNNIACIWIDVHKPVLQSRTGATTNCASKTRDSIICGIAVANIFTGTSYISEFQQPLSIQPTTFDELERAITTHAPSEIVFISPFEKEDISSILQFSGIHSKTVHLVDSRTSEKATHCTQQKYISHILETFYGNDAINTCAEFNIYPTATQSFCYLLDFVQEHNPNLVKNISTPTFHTNNEMILANHTLKQLNILDDHTNNSSQHGHLSSVNSFLNKCCTSMGKRMFFSQLVNPTTDQDWLETEYDMTEEMMHESMLPLIPQFRKTLMGVRDVERICRQIVMRKIYPSSIYYLHNSIQSAMELYNNVCGNVKLQTYLNECKKDVSKSGTRIMEFIDNNLFIDLCKNVSSTSSFDECIIRQGVNSELDEMKNAFETNGSLFKHIHNVLNYSIRTLDATNGDTEYVKIHTTEKMGMSLIITKKRSSLLKEYIRQNSDAKGDRHLIPDCNGARWSEIRFSSASGNCEEIDFPVLTKVCRDILHQKDKLNKLISESYQNILGLLEVEYYEDLEYVARYLAKIDVLQTKAYIAKEYRYCRPTIDSTEGKAFVDAKALRHVLIEHIQTNELYVANDISIGKDNQDGVLLYGTNAVGKTSLIRALGIAVIMAQSGLFVPCGAFVYRPYRAIFSRILGNDNLFKGLSTFAVEMSELRVILKLSDENSLILGDELCSGTETESALSIFVAGLMDLHNKRTSYIFATHFHEIVNYEEIRGLTRLVFKHMAVYYDRELDALIYDRKLCDGPGNKMYGLEVCKSLHLPEDFLQQAYYIRTKYFPDTKGELSHQPSKYNAGKIRGKCELCETELGVEIHHLNAQKDADSDGFITCSDMNVIHKNHPANLLSVCEECHDKYHASSESGTLVRKKTNNGYHIVIM